MESSEIPIRVLVVAHKTAATQPLLDVVRERAQRGPCTFTLLVPNATHGLHKIVDPEDQSAGEANAVIDHALPLLSEAAGTPSRESWVPPTRAQRCTMRSTGTASTR